MSRPDWDSYFMTLAHTVSTRSSCSRKHVGCVLVRDKRLLSSGYNGSIPGAEHCDDVGHDLIDSVRDDGTVRPNCVRTVHAETNAVAQAARFGVATDGADAYINAFPCWSCFKVLASAGIKNIFYDNLYRDDKRVYDAALVVGITIHSMKAPPAQP